MIEPFLTLADRVLGAGYSAVVSGSVVRGDHIPGRSDYNLLVVAERLGPPELKGLGPEFARFAAEDLGPPLLVTRAEWARAADVFPIEIADMRTAYKVVRGTDPLAGQSVRPEELRRALESEFRGKLLRLRCINRDDFEVARLLNGISALSIELLDNDGRILHIGTRARYN